MAVAAQVVIVGGGVVGASIAYHLAARGCRNVVVLDRGEPAQGSTGRATGGYRAQFGTEIHVRMSLLSQKKLMRFPDEVGVDSGYRPNGYLFCASSESQVAALKAVRKVQEAGGVTDAVFLSPKEMQERVPELRGDDLLLGSFCPTDGFVQPLAIRGGYQAASERLGATYRWNETVKRVAIENGAVVGVETNREFYATRCLVVAAGAWSASVAALAGVPDLPVVPVRRQVAITDPFPKLSDSLPMVIDCATGFHTRMRNGRALLLWADPNEPPGFTDTFDPAFLDAVLPKAIHRLPCLAEATVRPEEGWAGLYEVTPDHHGILGWASETNGLLLATGFSGHGVMHSPATGQLVAELILDGEARTLDIAALRPQRFAEGILNREAAVI